MARWGWYVNVCQMNFQLVPNSAALLYFELILVFVDSGDGSSGCCSVGSLRFPSSVRRRRRNMILHFNYRQFNSA